MVKEMSETVEESVRPIAGIWHIGTVENIGSRAGRHSLKFPIFDWAAKHKYTEFRNFKMEVVKFFTTNNYIMT